MNYNSRTYNLAKSVIDSLPRVLHSTDASMTKMLGILGSDLIKGVVDQKFVLEKVSQLSS